MKKGNADVAKIVQANSLGRRELFNQEGRRA